jgi:phosphonate transport system substrate-binding protein
MPLLLTLASCSGEAPPYEKVSFRERASVPRETSPEKGVRLGMAPILSARAGGEGFTLLAEALSRRLSVPVVPLLGTDYREINAMLAFGQVEMGIVCTGALSDPQLVDRGEVFLVPLLRGTGTVYHGLIVAGKESGLRKFEDLRSRSFLFTDPLSLTGYFYPLSLLCGLGERPGNFFSAVGFSHSHDRSLEAVAGGSTDAAAVDETVFELWRQAYPARAAKTRVLLRSPEFPSPPIVVRKDLPSAEREALKQALLDLGSGRGDGKAVLEAMGWSGIAEADADYLRRVEELRRFYRNLHEQGCLSP